MYPSKSTLDYMSELNRLFPRNSENDINKQANTSSYSLFSQSAINNSSSTDSASPESLPDITLRQFHHKSPAFHQFRTDVAPALNLLSDQYNSPITSSSRMQHYDYPESVGASIPQWDNYQSPGTSNQWRDHESPIIKRPIVGRKIMTSDQPTLEMTKFDPTIWRNENPPKANIEQNNSKHNVPYELFPAKNKGFEFKYVQSDVSPTSSVQSTYNLSPITNVGHTSPSYFTRSHSSFTHPNFPEDKLCTFCHKNGETPSVYLTHRVKEKIGNRQVVSCPILRSHVCSTCGATGDKAHTITYCPVLRSSNNGQPLQSTTITLKNTRIQSNGRRRY